MITHLFGDLKLRLLLVGMHRLMVRAKARSPRVRELLASGPLVLQICTEGGSGGHLVVRDGGVSIRFGLHPSPDFTQTWKNGNFAFKALTSGDETELLRAFEDGRYRMSGSFSAALWLNEVMKLAKPRAMGSGQRQPGGKRS